jgi:hypothetical protein
MGFKIFKLLQLEGRNQFKMHTIAEREYKVLQTFCGMNESEVTGLETNKVKIQIKKQEI